MTRVSLDGKETEVGQANNLREVLGQILATLPECRVVTEITLDGKQYYSHQTRLGDTSPSEFHEIEVRTSDREVIAANGFEMALSNVRRVQQSLIHVAEKFREKDLAEANLLFARCLDSLAKFMELLSATREVLNLDFSKIHLQNGTLATVGKELNLILEGLALCQKEQDYQELADRIEYELLTNLHSWTHALHVLTRAPHE